jgi:hypothetical protein
MLCRNGGRAPRESTRATAKRINCSLDKDGNPLADPKKDGTDILVKAKEASCPIGYHSVDGRPPPAPPPDPSKPLDPVDTNDLPLLHRLAVKALLHFQIEQDAGAGDTLHRLLNDADPIVSATVRAFQVTMKTMGWDCGCDRRRREMNERFPNRKGSGATA